MHATQDTRGENRAGCKKAAAKHSAMEGRSKLSIMSCLAVFLPLPSLPPEPSSTDRHEQAALGSARKSLPVFVGANVSGSGTTACRRLVDRSGPTDRRFSTALQFSPRTVPGRRKRHTVGRQRETERERWRVKMDAKGQ